MKYYFWGLMLFCFLSLPLGSKAMTLSKTEQGSIVSVEVYRTMNEREAFQQGTGFFIDYEGCLLTNSHILYNSSNIEEVYDIIKILFYENVRKKSSGYGYAKPKYIDREHDIAVVCLEDNKGKFYHPLKILSDQEYENLEVGEDMVLAGFPEIGGDTLTFSQGNIIGFWDSPDLQKFLGMSRFNDKEIDLVKSDSITGPGGSGSPGLSQNKKVLGIVFAASVAPGGINFLISSKTINSALNKLYNTEIKENAPNCSSMGNGLYQRDGMEFYDHLCQKIRVPKFEELVKMNFEARCGYLPEASVVHGASSYIGSGKSDIDKFWVYLQEMCPLGKKREDKKADAIIIESNLEKGRDFAYGKSRVADLVIEQDSAKVLKKELLKFGLGKEVKVSAKNWSTLVNAYLYGGYTSEAIYKSVLFGGYTVHPSIPFDQWKNSSDYIKYIKK